jgi:hypothetical protein
MLMSKEKIQLIEVPQTLFSVGLAFGNWLFCESMDWIGMECLFVGC